MEERRSERLGWVEGLGSGGLTDRGEEKRTTSGSFPTILSNASFPSALKSAIVIVNYQRHYLDYHQYHHQLQPQLHQNLNHQKNHLPEASPMGFLMIVIITIRIIIVVIIIIMTIT